MALPLIPLAALGVGSFMLWRGLAAGSVAAGNLQPAVGGQLPAGKIAFQRSAFPGIVKAVQVRGGLRARGPALGSSRGWAFQAVERGADGEDQILFAAPSGRSFLVRGGFYTYYDRFMPTLGRPVTDEYKRLTNYYDQLRGFAGGKPFVITQDFEHGRMDWVPTTDEVHIYDKKKRIGGWRRKVRKNSYHWWDQRSSFMRGLAKLSADTASLAAIGVGASVCVGGGILTAGAALPEVCQLGAKLAATTCNVNTKMRQYGETFTKDAPASSKLDFPDQGYLLNQKDTCEVIDAVNSFANGWIANAVTGAGGDDAEAEDAEVASGVDGLRQLGIFVR